MPELPEVEMVARHLKSLLENRTILKAQLLRPGLAPENSVRQFSQSLRNAVFANISRRGKHLLLHFSNGKTLIVHLRMTGRFLYFDRERENPPHTHALFLLDDQKKLVFADQRHFGLMHLVPTNELASSKYLAKLAPEPFSENFSDEYLQATLKRSKQPIKLALLDQTKVLGLGNIYASEALYHAQISPRLSANNLSPSRTKILRRKIIAVLAEAIAHNSTMNTDPENIDGSYTGGVYESMTKVYEREGLPCFSCQTSIQRFTQGGRSTYYCPRCQKR